MTHYRIKENENKFSITGDCSFDTIDEMIEYYQRNLLGVPGYTLSSPCEIVTRNSILLNLKLI